MGDIGKYPARSFFSNETLKAESNISWSHSPNFSAHSFFFQRSSQGWVLLLVIVFALPQGWIPLVVVVAFAFPRSPSADWSISDGPYRLVEANGPEVNMKRTLRPSGLNHSVGSVRPFGNRGALARQSHSYRPRYVRTALIRKRHSYRLRYIRTVLARQSHSYSLRYVLTARSTTKP